MAAGTDRRHLRSSENSIVPGLTPEVLVCWVRGTGQESIFFKRPMRDAEGPPSMSRKVCVWRDLISLKPFFLLRDAELCGM